jgi:hypothetical protein
MLLLLSDVLIIISLSFFKEEMLTLSIALKLSLNFRTCNEDNSYLSLTLVGKLSIHPFKSKTGYTLPPACGVLENYIYKKI